MFLRILIILILSFYSITSYSQGCGCVKIVFIVDNSGSITTGEFDQMKFSINNLGTQILDDYDQVQLSIFQYATDVDYLAGTSTHLYDISVPFTDDPAVFSAWNRNYGTGTPNPDVYEDHLPGSLYSAKTDGIWSVGGALDIESGGCSVKFFLFTDAAKSMPGGCCSVLKNLANAPAALPEYGEYNYLKNTYDAKFVVYHVAPDTDAEEAGAAVASVGGSYIGPVDANAGDPDGSGVTPRLYTTGNFNLSQVQIDAVIDDIDPTGDPISFSAPDTVCIGEPASFVSEGAEGFDYVFWDFGDGNTNNSDLYVTNTYNTVGTYQVEHRYEKNGCIENIQKDVVVEICLANKFRINIPNSFTPDNDGINDVLEIYFDGVAEAELFIYNRWGEKVYQTNDLNQFWDGRFESQKAKQDVYVYRVKCKDIYNNPHEIIGHVTLIR